MIRSPLPSARCATTVSNRRARTPRPPPGAASLLRRLLGHQQKDRTRPASPAAPGGGHSRAVADSNCAVDAEGSVGQGRFIPGAITIDWAMVASAMLPIAIPGRACSRQCGPRGSIGACFLNLLWCRRGRRSAGRYEADPDCGHATSGVRAQFPLRSSSPKDACASGRLALANREVVAMAPPRQTRARS